MSSRRPSDRPRRLAAVLLLLGLGATRGAFAATPQMDQAAHDVNFGRVDAAVALLRPVVAANPQDGAAHLLLCRAFLSEEQHDLAVPECEAAVAAMPASSAAEDWLGRAYGLKASKAGPLNGFVLARKVRDAFQAAVHLDPHNGAAVNDLGEYYVSAPAIVGGGLDKANALANQFQSSLPQQADRIRALAAEKAGNRALAERQFRAAVEVAHQPGAWVDLAAFYARTGNLNAALDAIHACVAADTQHDAVLVDAASVLTDMHREPDLAERLLREYLNSSAQSDAAPAFRAHTMLGKLLLAGGDKAAAKTEFDNALALARDYPPARTARQNL